tara:strand:- start:1203 stop:2408 length:1206 start_codon:yes stop_codon:yes gene_type:complete
MPIKWWEQFPTALRLITKTRFLASMGAGGVIYLTPLVFNKTNFSATQIGYGLAIAALIGTISRLISGLLLDNGVNALKLIKATAIIASLGDLTLFNAQDYNSFLYGELLIGVSAGIYWPSIELAVPISCADNFPSSKGFALGRTADALGISLGAAIGTLAAWTGFIRFIYIFDIICLCLLFRLLINQNFKYKKEIKSNQIKISFQEIFIWLKALSPILLISLLATGILSSLQSALPLDLVQGGLRRPPLSEGWSSGLIAIQLFLLVILQWPTGRWISGKNIKFGLRISLLFLGLGCLALGLSSLFYSGVIMVLLAQLPIAFGLAAFLPTATEAIISETDTEHLGLSMALFSQCFAISAFAAPIVGGRLLDLEGNGLHLWTGFFILCIFALILFNRISYLDR